MPAKHLSPVAELICNPEGEKSLIRRGLDLAESCHMVADVKGFKDAVSALISLAKLDLESREMPNEDISNDESESERAVSIRINEAIARIRAG